MKTTELANALDFMIHGNKARSLAATVQARFGNAVVIVHRDDKSMTVRAEGKDWDVWFNDDGDPRIVEAQ